MVWVYGDPPFSQRDKDIYLKLNRKLKNREFAEKIVKLLSLFNYIRNNKYSDWKELQNSVFFDDAKTEPVFDDKTAKAVFKLMQQKGGSQYPFINGMINDGFAKIGSVLPTVISEPISLVYNGATGAFIEVVDLIPFADLALEAGKTGAAVTNVAIENLAGAVGGAPGEVLAFLVTFVIASAAASVHLLERDFGGAIEQMFRAIPVIGTVLQTMLQKGEGIASKVDKDYEKIMGQFETVKGALSSGLEAVSGEGTVQEKLQRLKETPHAQAITSRIPQGLKDRASELRSSAQSRLATFKEGDTYKNLKDRASQLRNRFSAPAAGKRFSTMRNYNTKWKTTRRRRFVTH